MYFTPRQRKVAGEIAEATGDCYSGYCTAASGLCAAPGAGATGSLLGVWWQGGGSVCMQAGGARLGYSRGMLPLGM